MAATCANRIHQSSKILIKFVGKNINYDPYFWQNGIDQQMSLPFISRSTAGSIISSAFDLPKPVFRQKRKKNFFQTASSKITYIKDEKKLQGIQLFLISNLSPRDLIRL